MFFIFESVGVLDVFLLMIKSRLVKPTIKIPMETKILRNTFIYVHDFSIYSSYSSL